MIFQMKRAEISENKAPSYIIDPGHEKLLMMMMDNIREESKDP
jgi:hypothetical protein